MAATKRQAKSGAHHVRTIIGEEREFTAQVARALDEGFTLRSSGADSVFDEYVEGGVVTQRGHRFVFWGLFTRRDV